jgi:hypothetical protein
MHDYDTAAERRTDTTDIIVASDGAEILEDDPYTEHRESSDVGRGHDSARRGRRQHRRHGA